MLNPPCETTDEKSFHEILLVITIGTKGPQKSATTSVAALLGSFFIGLTLLVISTEVLSLR